VITAWHVDRPATVELLESLEWDVLRARRTGALVAPRGSGRTHLLRVVSERINTVQWESVYLPSPNVDPADFGRMILGTLDPRPVVGDPEEALERRLQALWSEGRSLFVAVDDAETMSEATLRACLALAEKHAPTLVMLFAFPSDAEPSGVSPSAREFDALPVVRLGAPMSPEETASYLRHRLARAGTSPDIVGRFSDEVTLRLHELSGGEPFWLHTLAQIFVETPAESSAAAWDRFVGDERGILAMAMEAARVEHEPEGPEDADVAGSTQTEAAAAEAASGPEAEPHVTAGDEPEIGAQVAARDEPEIGAQVAASDEPERPRVSAAAARLARLADAG